MARKWSSKVSIQHQSIVKKEGSRDKSANRKEKEREIHTENYHSAIAQIKKISCLKNIKKVNMILQASCKEEKS